MKLTRNEFLKASGIAAALSVLPAGKFASASAKKTEELHLGVASYTFRKFSLEETIDMVKKMGIRNLALKSMHMPLDSSPAEIKKAAQKVRDAGINLYGAGVIYMKNKEQVDQAFDYAKTAGLDVIIGVPGHELLPYVNQKVKDYDIKVAIHNHGPGDDLYPSPSSVMEKVKDLDKRIGLCIDIGHTKRIQEDPAKLAAKYSDRLHDVHVKDVNAAKAEGRTVEIGRGVIDIPGFLKTLQKINYDGMVSLEYEKDGDDPLAGSAESIGYLRGVLTML